MVQITEMGVFRLPGQLDRQLRQFCNPHELLYRFGVSNCCEGGCGRRNLEE